MGSPIASDIGFLCMVPGQISAYKAAEQGVPMPSIINMLSQMVRAGDYDRHHMALRQMIKKRFASWNL